MNSTPSKHRADVDKSFIRRFLIISLGCFGFMLWGLYDGIYSAPMELDRAHAYKELIAKSESGELAEDERTEAWKVMCETNGWPTSKPKTPEVAKGYVYFQWFVFGLGLLGGLAFMWHYLRLLNAWVESDDQGVETSWGQSLKFENITEVNKRKWIKKGIAKIAYTDESGKKTMVLDDFKFDRETMGLIMSKAEEQLTDEQIIGDKRESVKAAEAAEAAAKEAEAEEEDE